MSLQRLTLLYILDIMWGIVQKCIGQLSKSIHSFRPHNKKRESFKHLEVHGEYDHRGHYIERANKSRKRRGNDEPKEKEIHKYLKSRTDLKFIREHVLKTGSMGHSNSDLSLWAPQKRDFFCSSHLLLQTLDSSGICYKRMLFHVFVRWHGLMALKSRCSIYDGGCAMKNTLDHRTWETCYAEIQNCAKQGSIGAFFFLSLQGDKYGYCPLPRTINKQLFDDRLATEEDDSLKVLAHKWYYLDENALPSPGIYVLKPLRRLDDESYWNEALPRLRNLLKDLSFWPLNPKIVVGHSVSEYEFLEAERLGIQRCAWLQRHIKGGKDSKTDPRQLYSEWDSPSASLLHSNLLATMVSSFGTSQSTDSSRVVKIDVKSDHLITRTIEDGNTTRDITYDHKSYASTPIKESTNKYCERWKRSAFDLLQEEVDRCSMVSDLWAANGEGIGLSGTILQEILHHYVWGYEKLVLFSGREELLSSALSIIEASEVSADKADKPRDGLFSGITLAIYGKSGSGKTAFCSKLADTLRLREQAAQEKNADTCESRPVLLRFCGTSHGSGTGTMLVLYLCHQIHYILGRKKDDIPSTYGERVKHLENLLAKHPMILVIDSLDQLSNEDEARSNLTFLRNIKPHPRTIIIVSSIPDEIGNGYTFGCSSRLNEAHVPSVKVPVTSEGAKEFLANYMEKRYQRKVTENQMEMVIQQSEEEPTALWFTLAARIASTWTSSMPVYHEVSNPNGGRLEAGVKPLLNLIFDQISKDFGQELTCFALTLLTIARNGIKSSEMEDLLSLDDQVLDDVFQYSKPNIRRIPVHVWLRLKNHLANLIVDVADGCLVWYHKQLRESAQTRFIDFEEVDMLNVLILLWQGISATVCRKTYETHGT